MLKMTTKTISTHERQCVSKNKMIITAHAKQRAAERTNFCLKKDKLKETALTARYKGLDFDKIAPQDVGGREIYAYLKENLKISASTDKFKFYKNYIFVFCGENSRTLRTIINIPQKI